ncbi:MAG: DUF4350 domain-containing protein [Bradymonadia bacterium]
MIWIWVLLLLWTQPSAASFEGESTDWDGLSRITQGLRRAGVPLTVPTTLDFGALPPGSGLAIVGPDAAVDADNLMRFVQSGGRLLLADEGAAMGPFLARVGLAAVDAPPPNDDTLGGRQGLRVLNLEGRGGLLEGISALVTNHPGALEARRALGPAITFNDGTPFAFHLQIGAGEAVVMADPSVFINNMQTAGDNARLAANIGAWLNAGGRPVTLVGGDVPSQGNFRGDEDPGSTADALSTLNISLAQLGAFEPDTVVIRLLVAILLAAAILYVILVFPGGSTRRRAMAEARQQLHPGTSINGLAGQPGGPAAPEGRPTAQESVSRS